MWRFKTLKCTACKQQQKSLAQRCEQVPTSHRELLAPCPTAKPSSLRVAELHSRRFTDHLTPPPAHVAVHTQRHPLSSAVQALPFRYKDLEVAQRSRLLKDTRAHIIALRRRGLQCSRRLCPKILSAPRFCVRAFVCITTKVTAMLLAPLLLLLLLAGGLIHSADAATVTICESHLSASNTCCITPFRFRSSPPSAPPFQNAARPAPTKPTNLPPAAAAATCADIKRAFLTIKANSTACVKAAYTIELGCNLPYDCTNIFSDFNLADCPGLAKQPVVAVTVKPARSCGTDRPVLLSIDDTTVTSLFYMGSPRGALALKSIVLRCGGERTAVSSDFGKSLSLTNVDIDACSSLSSSQGKSAIVAYFPVKIKGGALKNHPVDTDVIYLVTSDSPPGTTLSLSRVAIENNGRGVRVRKVDAAKLKVAVKGCKFSNNAPPTGDCLVYAERRELGAAADVQTLTLDLGGSTFQGAITHCGRP